MFRLSAAVGVGVALLLFLARGTLVDEIMFRRAMRLSSEPGFLTYLARGKRHADEVKTVLLPRAALEAARQGGTVTALQAFRRRFPGSAVDDEARKSLHELYDRALGELRARYSTADPHLLPFMEKLLAYLEAHGDSSVVVDFHSPSPEAMGLVDNVVRSGATGGGSVALVAPSFDGEHSLPRESKILQGLQAGFAAMVPTGAMVLRPGRRIADLTMTPAEALPKKRAATPIPDAKQPDPPPELISPLGAVHVPTLEVHYRVGWSGDVSIWKKGEPRIAGVVIRFDVTMRLPDQPDTFGFSLEVPPPDHFPAYDVTADRAFDQLADKLRAVFVLPHDDGRAGQREPPPGGTRQ